MAYRIRDIYAGPRPPPFAGWRLAAAAIIAALLPGEAALRPETGPDIVPPWLDTQTLWPLLPPAAGWLIARRIGARRAMLIGLPIAAAGFVLGGLWSAWPGFLLALPLVAAGAALGGWLPAATIINDHFRRRPATAFAMLALVPRLASPLVGLAAGAQQTLAVASGIFALAVAFPLARRMPDPPAAADGNGDDDADADSVTPTPADGRPTPEPEYTLREALRSRDFWLLLAGLECIQIASTAALWNIFTPAAQWICPASYYSGYGYFGYFILSVAAIPASGLLGDRMPLRRALLLFALPVLAGTALMAAASGAMFGALRGAMFEAGLALAGIDSVAGVLTLAALGAYFGRRDFALLLGISALPTIATQALIIGIAALSPQTPSLTANIAVISALSAALAYAALGHPHPSPSQQAEQEAPRRA